MKLQARVTKASKVPLTSDTHQIMRHDSGDGHHEGLNDGEAGVEVDEEVGEPEGVGYKW